MDDASLTLTVKHEPLQSGIWVLSASGTIDFSTAAHFEKQLATLIEKKPSHVLFDMGSVDYISSNGLGVLIDLFKKCRKGRIGLGIYDPQLAVRRVLEISKLNFLITDPDAIGGDSPFTDYLKRHEPERKKRREEKAAQKRPPRLYS